MNTLESYQEAGLRPASFVKWLGVLWAVVALLLYMRTLAPGVVALHDDTLEFQLVAVRGAIPHPTGYPLYALLLTLVARLIPLGEIAYRANMLSALVAAGAVGVTYYVARRLNMGVVAASGAALLFAITPTFWGQATIAEVYSLHILLSALLWWRFLVWLDRVKSQKSTGQPSRPIPPTDVFLIIGLGFAHHRMMVLWLPALFLAWLIAVGRFPHPKGTGLETRSASKRFAWDGSTFPIAIKPVGIALIALILPLLLYLWLPIRSGVGSIDGTYSQVGFSCWVTACQYASFFSDNALATARPLSYFGDLTLNEISVFGVVLALIGLTRLIRLPLAKSVLLVVGLLTNAIFAIAYRVPDPEVFWVPTIWVLCLFVGLGMQQLRGEGREARNEETERNGKERQETAKGRGRLSLAPTFRLGQAQAQENDNLTPQPLSRLQFGEGETDGTEITTSSSWLNYLRHGAVVLGLSILLLFLITTRWADADRSILTGNPTLNGISFNGRDVLNQPLPPDSVVIGLLGEITYLRYLQEANGVAPTIATAGGDDETLRLAALDAALAKGQHPFLTRELEGLGGQYSLSALGPLIEVLPQPRTAVPEGLYPLNQPVTDAITLAAWTRSPIAGSEGMERLTVAWQVNQLVPLNLNISARVVGDNDTLACETCQVDTPPVRNAYPTSQWRVGEFILDTYDLPPIPQGAHYLLILYNPTDGAEMGRATIIP